MPIQYLIGFGIIFVLLYGLYFLINPLIPKRKQYGRWKLPSKHGTVSLIIAIICLPITLLTVPVLYDYYVEKFSPIGLTIQTNGSQATAAVSDATVSEYNRAIINILVTISKSGRAVTDLAPQGWFKNNSRSEISLPSGWKLKSALVPAGGCTLKPTNFYNSGDGVYRIVVNTISAYDPCPWLTGEYNYEILISQNGLKGIGTGKVVIK